MRTKFLLLIIFFLLFRVAFTFSQSLPEQDCISAISVCQETFTQTKPYIGIGSPTAGQGPGGNEINGNQSCLNNGEKNDVWYTFTVQNSGNLCFSIIPAVLTDDFDWALFDLTTYPCDSIYTKSSLEMACNFKPIAGVTGANGLQGEQNGPCIAVIAGQTYVLNVSQFSPSSTGYTLDFSASTAQLYDNIPPVLQDLAQPAFCGDTLIVVEFSENVICSTVQPSGFSLIGPSGNIAISSVNSIACTKGSTYDSQFFLSVPPLAPLGNYKLLLHSTAGVQDLCSNSNTKTDTVYFSLSPFPLTLNSTPQICNNSNGTATVFPEGGIAPYDFLWNTSPVQTSQTASGLTQGSFSVVVTDAAGCVSNNSVTVPYSSGPNPPSAQITSSSNATCAGINDGNATVTVIGGNSPYSYSWNIVPSSDSPTVTSLAPGTVVCTVTDNSGCSDTAIVVIGNLNPINVSISPPDTFICSGSSALLTALVSGGTSPYTIEWFKYDTLLGTNNPLLIAPDINTPYKAVASDGIGCMSDTVVVDVSIFPPLTVSITPVTVLCPGQTKNLTAIASGGKGTGYTYSWSGSGESTKDINVSPSVNTTFYVTVSDSCSSVNAVDSVLVTVGQTPSSVNVMADKLDGCTPLEVVFTFNPFTPGYEYIWHFGQGDSLIDYNDSVTYNYSEGGCKKLNLSVITGEGCYFDSLFYDSCMINPFPSPVAGFSFFPKTPATTRPMVNFNDASIGATSWNWDFDNFTTSIQQSVQHEFSDSGNYNVKLIASNGICSDTVIHTVYVEYETTIYIPNSFSPDEDDLNDYFTPAFEGIVPEKSTMYIFDRSGRLVYSTDKLEAWDGKINGVWAQQGVYVYKIAYTDFEGKERILHGTLTLIK